MKKPKILVIDDDESIRTQMKWGLVGDYDIYLAMDAPSAMEVIKTEQPPLVTLDLGLPPDPGGISEGLKLLTEILELDKTVKILVVTGNPERSSALDAVGRGAHDFFTKPVNIEELKAILKRAYYVHSLEAEHRTLQHRLDTSSFGEIIGSSAKMTEVFNIIRRVSTTDVPVLITGASGTGKELIARSIHSHSSRQDKPIVTINCGAIPENLMESELFGHEKGSFTGAHTKRLGRIETADGGTLFLDEIGELPLALQVKLLRFLQDHKIERIGGRESIDIDVRVIAATNRNIKKLAKQGLFREDLYYRLAVISIALPLLRERDDDIIHLAKAFLHRYSDPGKKPMAFGHSAEETMKSYKWPGNVRELENKVRRAITFAKGATITPADMGFDETSTEAMSLDIKDAKITLEMGLINKAIVKHNGNIKRAAGDLGITRPTLYSLMKKYGIKQSTGA
jgi:two-component system NtrC family response regulator